MTSTLFEPPILPVQIAWAVIVFVVGSAIGSFLNVIIYRWPAGLSIVRPASRCPKCETPIRAFDNVPIFGWLWLRGRCRACGQPISARYPLVELTVALIFLTLGWVEPIREGWNLPRPPLAPDAPLPILATGLSEGQRWGMFAFHTALLVWLLAESLWNYDAARFMKRLFLPLAAAALLAPIWCPWLHPISAVAAIAPERLGPIPYPGLIDSVVGVVFGAMLGALAGPATGLGPRGIAGRTSASMALAVVGAILGWQTVLPIAAATTGLFLLTVVWGRMIPPLGAIPFSGCLLIATWAWILAWRPIVARLPELGFQANHWTIGLCGGAVTILSALTWAVRSRA